MQVFEIYTLGTGFYLEKILNALRMILGDGSFISLIKSSALCALALIAIKATISNDFKIISRWVLSAVVIVSLFLTTKAHVIIHDTLPDSYGQLSAARKVENVPWGLAALASITSTTGDYLGKKFETAFAGAFVNSSYAKTGMLFGTKIVEDTSSIRASDPHITQFMLKFYHGCVVPDVLMGKERANGYTLSDLAAADDLANFLSEHSSKARMLSYAGELDKYPVANVAGQQSGKVKGYISCKNAAERLEAAVKSDAMTLTNALGSSFIRHFMPNGGTSLGGKNRAPVANAASSFNAVMSDSYSLFINSSREASDILKQNIIINSLKDSVNNVGEAYANITTNKMVESSFSSLSKWASKLSLQLKSAFEAVVYGMFPIVLVLLVTPIGMEVLKNYAMSFVYLQMWQPIYAVLFCIAAAYGEYEASGINALTFATHGVIAQVNHDISMIAGYMLLCVPVIALYATRGMFSSMGNMASSIFYVPQHAALSASEQAVRGNYNMGNTSIDTHNFNTTSGNKHDDNYAWMSGMKSFAMPSGAIEKSFADGRTALDVAPALSNMGGLTRINFSQMMGSRLEQSETSALNDLNRHSSDMVESSTAAYSKMLGFNSHFSKGSSQYENWQKSLGSEERKSFEEAHSMMSRFAQDHNISTDDAVRLAVAASAGISFDKIPVLGKHLPSGSIGADKSKASNYRKAFDALISGDNAERYAESFSKLENYMNNSSYQEQTGHTRDQLDSIKQDLHSSNSANYARSRAIERVEGISKLRSDYQSNSANIDQEMQHKFTEWGVQYLGAAQFEKIQRDDPVLANKLAHDFITSMAPPILSPVTSSDNIDKLQRHDAQVQAATTSGAKLTSLIPVHADNQNAVANAYVAQKAQTYEAANDIVGQEAVGFQQTVQGSLNKGEQLRSHENDSIAAKQSDIGAKLVEKSAKLNAQIKEQKAISEGELNKGVHVKVGENMLGKEKKSAAFDYADGILNPKAAAEQAVPATDKAQDIAAPTLQGSKGLKLKKVKMSNFLNEIKSKSDEGNNDK